MRQFYSFYFDAFWIAVKSILEHKLRAFLTLIGIIIGVAAVVVVGASISGLENLCCRQGLKGPRHKSFHDHAAWRPRDGWPTTNSNERTAATKTSHWNEYRICQGQLQELSCMSEPRSVPMPTSLRTASRCRRRRSSAHRQHVRDRPKRRIDRRPVFLGRRSRHVRRSVCVIGTDVEEKFFPNGSADREDAEAPRHSACRSLASKTNAARFSAIRWTA